MSFRKRFRRISRVVFSEDEYSLNGFTASYNYLVGNI